MQLFDTSQYQVIEEKRDWEGAGYDPAWDDGSSEKQNQHSGSIEPPSPDDFATLPEFSKAWEEWAATVEGTSEEELAKKNAADIWESKCSNTFPSSQELGDLKKELESPGETSPPPSLLKSTPTRKQSCELDTQESPSTQTLEPIPPEVTNITSQAWVSPVPEPASLETEADSNTQDQGSGLRHCDVSASPNPGLSLWNSLKELSIADYEQYLQDSEWLSIKQKLSLSRQRHSERRTKGTASSLLPTPTTYAKGSGKCRPAGATRLEQSLRKFIAPGDKLHPAVPGWMMGFPPGWVEDVLMDIGQAELSQLSLIPECDTTRPNDDNVTTSTPDPSVPSKQLSLSGVSSTSKACCPNCEQPLLNLTGGCGCCGWMQSEFLGDKLGDDISSRKVNSESEFLGDKLDDEISPRKVEDDGEFLGDKLDDDISPKKSEERSQFLGDKLDDEISPRKTRRSKGDGSGSIHWRTVTKKGKDYHEAYYHYEFWSGGDRLVKSSKYIPKRLLSQVQRMEVEKAPVREILGVLGVKL